MLTVLQESFLLGALEEKNEGINTIFHPVNDSPEWSRPLLPWQWNLTASDKSLKDRFMLYINEERRRNGLPDDVFKKKGKSGVSKSYNESNRNRGISWRGLELLDIQYYKINALFYGITTKRGGKAVECPGETIVIPGGAVPSRPKR